jgi:AcrR family transcriptional regulator
MEVAKQEGILRAAINAFTRHGFRKASVDEIAREAGVAKGTIYLCCQSKEDLFYQAVHREVRAFSAEMVRRIDPRKPADELLRDIASAGVTFLENHPLARDLMLGILRGQMPHWESRLDELRNIGRANAEELLRIGVRQGVFRADIDVEEVASILQDLQLSAYVLFSRSNGDEARLERRADAIVDLVLNGLRPR